MGILIFFTWRRLEYINLIRDGVGVLLPPEQFYFIDTYLFSNKYVRFSTLEKSSVLSTLKSTQEPDEGLTLLDQKLKFSIALESIHDDVLDISLSDKNIQNIEEAYREPQKMIEICILLLNNPPSIVTRLFEVLDAFDQLDKSIKKVEDFYTCTINQLLNMGDVSCFEKLEKIVRSVVEYLTVDEDDDSDSSGWGLDDETDEDSAFGAVEVAVKNILLKAIGRVEDFDLEDISKIKNILNQVKLINLILVLYFNRRGIGCYETFGIILCG